MAPSAGAGLTLIEAHPPLDVQRKVVIQSRSLESKRRESRRDNFKARFSGDIKTRWIGACHENKMRQVYRMMKLLLWIFIFPKDGPERLIFFENSGYKPCLWTTWMRCQLLKRSTTWDASAKTSGCAFSATERGMRCGRRSPRLLPAIPLSRRAPWMDCPVCGRKHRELLIGRLSLIWRPPRDPSSPMRYGTARRLDSGLGTQCNRLYPVGQLRFPQRFYVGRLSGFQSLYNISITGQYFIFLSKKFFQSAGGSLSLSA